MSPCLNVSSVSVEQHFAAFDHKEPRKARIWDEQLQGTPCSPQTRSLHICVFRRLSVIAQAPVRWGNSRSTTLQVVQSSGTSVALILEAQTYQVELIWNVSRRRRSNFTFTHACVTRSKPELEVQHNYSHLLESLKHFLLHSPPQHPSAKHFPTPAFYPQR